ncbi:MAG TPA: PepSY-associated TM helix domain-containing protein, partial [Vicinamibacteria bacterium]|nr:PepSY-associated TM helix domain-containing protein [Vicinamibacteria bacterium]
MALRKVFFWLHLTAGVLAGLVILVLSVTGTLLMYEKQVTRWADGYRRAPAAGATRLPIETLLARVRETRSAPPTSVMLEADPTAPASLGYGREGTLFVDPYDGAVLGEGSTRARAFFRSVTDWHRWLSTEGDNRALGKAVTGAANLIFLFIVMSGFYLWWPRSWTWRSLRAVTWFQGGLPGKARDFNWHNVIGLWMAVPLFFVVLGGVVISYPWATALVYRLTGSPPP